MPSFLHVLISRIRGYLRPDELDRVDHELREELEAHLAMAEEDFLHQGLSPAEARRRARVELGGLTQLREASREARGLPALDTFWLDLKLGFRMLKKSWGLTLVGGLAMTLAIGIGVIVFWLLETFFFPTLPLDEGDRVVAIQTWDGEAGARRPTSIADIERWQQTLRSMEDFGAFRTVERNVVTEGDGSTPERIAQVTASGFELTRVAPLLGRPLLASDEAPGADPVVVIGYEAWQQRFAGDPRIVGRIVHIGETAHTVVGVMPAGFAFPVSHGFWTPLHLDSSRGFGPTASLETDGPEAAVFARLRPGVSMQAARAELAALGLVAPEAREEGSELGPRLVSYTFAFTGDFETGDAPWVVRVILFVILLLLIPPCANIAILVYARTLTRQEELAARFALGASRGRIVGQLFLEVLVLALVAAGAALFLASLLGAYMEASIARQAGDGVPFWLDFSLSYRAVLFAALLALAAAAVAGIVPALRATGRRMQSTFNSLGSRNSLRLGRTWTVLVVAQVALTLSALPAAVELGWGTLRDGILGPGFAAEEYLAARLGVDRQAFVASQLAGIGEESELETRFASRFVALRDELVRQAEEEPGVVGISVSTAPPDEEPWAHIEIEGQERKDGGVLDIRRLVRLNRVDPAFFDLYGMRVLIGRDFEASDFTASDLASEAAPTYSAVIVNQTFALRNLGDGNPLGRRFRYTHVLEDQLEVDWSTQQWYEVVGVVNDVPANPSHGTFYHARGASELGATSFSVHLAGDPSGTADRLRDITQALEPALRLDEVATLDEIYRGQQVGNNIGASFLAIVTLSVLLLSAAGMYALMSFTVNHRRREIGIRSALGAQPSRVLLGIFRRALLQVGFGAFLGASVALLIDHYLPTELVGGWNVPGIIPLSGLFMMGVCLLALAGPARRGLRVDPITELREG